MNKLIDQLDLVQVYGRVAEVSGQTIISDGPDDVKVGDQVQIEIERNDEAKLIGEIVGFQNHRLIIMPLGNAYGIQPGARVLTGGPQFTIPASDQLINRIFDGLGKPLDNKGPIVGEQHLNVDFSPPSPTERPLIKEQMVTGVRSIDGLLSIGCGQRIGIFAGTGIGKSTLLGMIARYTESDVNVICLVGERGREVRNFIENDLGQDGMSRSVIFVSTGDRPAMEKIYCAGFATSVAEYFRNQGKKVNFYMDSITRFAMSLREVSIAAGEQLGPSGYPPSVWYKLSRLVERTGTAPQGSITAFYSVLVEADDLNDPIADNVRGILDGHIALSRRLSQKNHYPAIEITESISRVMDSIIDSEHQENAHHMRRLLATYRENEEIISLGAYIKESNPFIDEAIEKKDLLDEFLQQNVATAGQLDDTFNMMKIIVHGLPSIPEEDVETGGTL